jgi:hypothetical protein
VECRGSGRGWIAVDDLAVLTGYAGIVVLDAWSMTVTSTRLRRMRCAVGTSPRELVAAAESHPDLRPAKTQIKISGCHRSSADAQPGSASAATSPPPRKHRTNVRTALRDAITGNPWTPLVASGT